jgi:hippurate hydrolase
LPEDLLPVVTETGEAGPAVVNDAALARRVVEVFKKKLGDKNVLVKRPVMGSEDFSEYGRTEEKVPIFLFWLGTVSEEKWREAERSGKALPSLHSPFFAPDAERAIKTGVEATVAACVELLGAR